MRSTLKSRLRTSVRAKLLALVLAPLLAVLPVLALLTLYWANTYYDRMLIFKVNSDLVVARQYFQNVTDRMGRDLDGLARSHALVVLLERRGQGAVRDWLAQARDAHRLDFLYLLDPHGNIVQPASRFDASVWPIVKRALRGEAATAVDIFAPAQLAAIDPALARRAELDIVPTDNAAPSSRRKETRGLVIHAATPVHDAQGRLAGVLLGGTVLNQNLGFVDTINDLVYRKGSLQFGSEGTVTLFLDDVRIATNVRLFRDRRALGTRVSQEVRDEVLGRGATWLHRAFVVNDWYVSAYEPIEDSFGRRVGMLYVGFLEAPFSLAKTVALGGILLVIVLSGAAGGLVSLRWARSVFRPLEQMNRTMSAVEAGELSARTGPVESRDELGQLAGHFDQLLDKLEAQNRALKNWADELELKVAERTREIESANQLLRDAQRQLVMSEKLAAIGELTAGVAHEINNPAAVIQGNLDLLVEVLGAQTEPVREEIRLINEQIQRIRVIVTNLLQFARPAEFAGYVETVEVNRLLSDCLVLVRHQLGKRRIAVTQDCRATREVAINRNELQQVLINLMANAIHAMPEGGVLTLETRDWEDEGVTVTVRDTGVGIAPEVLPRIFDPFFTTRKQQGTGLGLSISYGLLERYGNRITVSSEPGRGATFTVWLHVEPVYAEGGETPCPARDAAPVSDAATDGEPPR